MAGGRIAIEDPGADDVRALLARFAPCGPFADYRMGPSSAWMTRSLEPGGAERR